LREVNDLLAYMNGSYMSKSNWENCNE